MVRMTHGHHRLCIVFCCMNMSFFVFQHKYLHLIIINIIGVKNYKMKTNRQCMS